MASEEYLDEMYCGHCEDDTTQTIHYSGHERDSSGDWRICHKCGWMYSGYSGKWSEYYTPEEMAANPFKKKSWVDKILSIFKY